MPRFPRLVTNPLREDLDFDQFLSIAMVCDNGDALPAAPVNGQWYLHDPGGLGTRIILYLNDGATWIPKMSFGNMTCYVDNTDGTDDLEHGTGVDAAAFATVQFAADCVPGAYGGDVDINVNDETYNEDVVIEGKQPTGNFVITITGTLTVSRAATIGVGSVLGNQAVQGTLVDSVGGMGVNAYQNLILHEPTTNDVYRIIDSNTATTFTITGTWPTGAPVNLNNYTVYDWGTLIDSINCRVGTVNLINLDLTGTGIWYCLAGAGTFNLERCQMQKRPFINNGIVALRQCLIHTLGGSAQFDVCYTAAVTVERTKIRLEQNTALAQVYNNASLVLRYGSIVDGQAGGNRANYGFDVYGNGSLYIQNTDAEGWCRVRNCDVGINARDGGMVTGTANNQYAGNGVDEARTAANSCGWVD